MQLRTGQIRDAEALAALIASFQHQLTDHPDGIGAEDFLASVSRDAEAGYLASERFEYVVACEADAVIGFLAVRDGTHVFHLFVAASHQGRGIASALWREAQQRALAGRGAPTFTVNSSLAAVPVYEAWGFRATGPVAHVHGISFLPMSRPGLNDNERVG